MNELTPEQKALSAQWAAVHAGAAQALDWIEQTRPTAPGLDSEADDLSYELHRVRNEAVSYEHAASRPMTVGFFGISQAGKSYLISALAAGQNERLETMLGGQRVDFMDQVNPVGMGKEATGLVTRFSRRATPAPVDQFPVELKLFKELDLVKILGNSWFKDFDQTRVSYTITEEVIQAALRPFEGRENGPLQPGFSADDVVSTWDYFRNSFANSVVLLEHSYWPHVLKLAPRLSVRERGELFSILWGKEQALTDVYLNLATSLHQLGLPTTVYAPLDALFSFDEKGRETQRDSIMSVDILARFGTDKDQPMDVLPVIGEQLQTARAIMRSHLAALTAEMTFRLVEAPKNPIVNEVDLLDFPGYRGRMSLSDIANIDDPTMRPGDNPVAQLILRGKVTYLFERYTDNHEMHALVLCTNVNKSIEINDIGPVLTRWIENTQGSTPQQRGTRDSGLIWAMTMFDTRIGQMLDKSEGAWIQGWNGMMSMTMLDRFSTYSWLNNWGNGVAFNNAYMVRKPHMKIECLSYDANKLETGILPEYQECLDNIGNSLLEVPDVCRHFSDPLTAWKAVLQIDGGMSRVSAGITAVASLDFKLGRIRERLEELVTTLTSKGLAEWYTVGGDGAIDVKRAQAQMIYSGLRLRAQKLGEFISHLQLPVSTVRDLYLSGEFEAATSGDDEQESAAPAPAVNSAWLVDDGYDDEPVSGKPTKTDASATKPQGPQNSGQRFARAAFNAWISHLRHLSGQQGLLNLLGIDKKLMDAVVAEVIVGAHREKVLEQLTTAVAKCAESNARRERQAERQVLQVQLVLRDFVSWFGYFTRPLAERPASRARHGNPLFSFYPKLNNAPALLDPESVPEHYLPDLPAEVGMPAMTFLTDWMSALAALTEANAGHGAGSEITPEQNERLGHVLQAYKAI